MDKMPTKITRSELKKFGIISDGSSLRVENRNEAVRAGAEKVLNLFRNERFRELLKKSKSDANCPHKKL